MRGAALLIALCAAVALAGNGSLGGGGFGPPSAVSTTNTVGFDGGGITPSSVTTPFVDAGVTLSGYVLTNGAHPSLSGTAPVLIGSRSSGTAGLYMAAAAAAPTSGNYTILQDATDRYDGAPSGGTIYTCVGNSCTMSWNGSSLTSSAGTVDFAAFKVGGKSIGTSTTPTLQSGFGTGASITATGSFSFEVNVGTTPGSTGTVRFSPAATNRWYCDCKDYAHATSTTETRLTNVTTADCVFTNVTTATGAGANWTDNSILTCTAFPH